jgi:hypothetical protein
LTQDLRIALVLVGIIFYFRHLLADDWLPSGWTFAHPFHIAEEESFGDETRQGSLIAFSRWAAAVDSGTR